MPREMGFDYTRMSFQEQEAAQGVPPSAIFGLSVLFAFLILAALYESWSLPFSASMPALVGRTTNIACRRRQLSDGPILAEPHLQSLNQSDLAHSNK